MAVKKTRKAEPKKQKDIVIAESLEAVSLVADNKSAVQGILDTPIVLSPVEDAITTTESLGLAPKKDITYPAELVSQEIPSVDINKSNSSAQKMVRINPRENHTCYIGDQWYYFRKHVQQVVPLQVKDILYKAKLLDPL